MGSDQRQHVSAVETTIAIVEALREREVAGVTELATALDMSKANVYKHLITLCDHGFLIRDGEQYRLGLRFFEIGSAVRQHRPLYHEAASRIQELADITNKAATLMIPNQNMGTYVRSVEPDKGGQPGILEGESKPLHESASGRAILACYSDAERTELLPETLTDDELAAVFDRLDQVSDRGVAISQLSQEDNLQEIAAPVTIGDGEPVGAVGLITHSATSTTEQVEPNYRKLVKKTGTTLSKRMRLRRNHVKD